MPFRIETRFKRAEDGSARALGPRLPGRLSVDAFEHVVGEVGERTRRCTGPTSGGPAGWRPTTGGMGVAGEEQGTGRSMADPAVRPAQSGRETRKAARRPDPDGRAPAAGCRGRADRGHRVLERPLAGRGGDAAVGGVGLVADLGSARAQRSEAKLTSTTSLIRRVHANRDLDVVVAYLEFPADDVIADEGWLVRRQLSAWLLPTGWF